MSQLYNIYHRYLRILTIFTVVMATDGMWLQAATKNISLLARVQRIQMTGP